MLALAEAFAKADLQQENSKMDEWEAVSLGVSVDVFREWRQGFHDTYTVARVHTLEQGYKMPQYKRALSWANCRNY